MKTSVDVDISNYLELLNLLSEVAASGENLDSVLQATVRLIQRLVQVERCSILLLDTDAAEMRMAACSGIPEEQRDEIHVALGEGIAGRVAQSGEPVLSQNVSEVAPERANDPKKYTTSSFISAPIRYGERTLGVINITNKYNRSALNEQDLALILSVARFLGLVLERARLVEGARAQHAHLLRTLDTLPLGVVTVAADMTLLMINPVARRLLRAGEPPAVGRPLSETLGARYAARLANLVERTLRNAQPQSREMEREAGENAPPLRLTALEIAAAAENQKEVVIVIEDLSLSYEVQELRRLDSLKSNFIAMVSHELRTPLTSIRGANHLLQTYYHASLQETHRRLVDIISKNTERLIQLVNNILDISLLDNHRLNLQTSVVDLAQAARQAAAEFEEAARRREIHLQVHAPHEPVRVWGDADRLAQVLGHVLSNALKYTPAGGEVNLRLQIEDDDAVIEVTDTGIGIGEDLREKVFERFFQGGDTLTRQSGGAGLGLFLARALVDLHGGTIRALEPKHAGARIHIRLPLETSSRSLKWKETFF